VSELCDLATDKQTIKRVQVSFSKGQWDLIKRFKPTMGDADADIVRNIVLAWLAEKSIITTDVKRKIENDRQ
jgi:predicted transcriptional regulator